MVKQPNEVPEKMRKRLPDSHVLPHGLKQNPNIGNKIPESLRKGIPDNHVMPDSKYDSF